MTPEKAHLQVVPARHKDPLSSLSPEPLGAYFISSAPPSICDFRVWGFRLIAEF
jgi:hypothetical protein